MGKRQHWAILGVVYLCVLAYAVTLQSVPPILSLVMTEFSLSHTRAGLLMSAFALPGIAVSIPAGMLADRYGQKAIGLVSLALMIAGTTVFITGGSFAVLLLGRVISGAGAITLMVLAPQVLAQWFTGREMGTAMGIYSTAVPLGTILSLNLSSWLGETLGWRASAWLSLGLPLISLAVFASLFTAAPQRSGGTRPRSSLMQDIRLSGASIWLIGAVWMLFSAATIPLFTFTPDWLRTTGFNAASAGFVTSAMMWPSLFLSPIVGYVMDKIDRKPFIIAAGGLALMGSIALVPLVTGGILALMFAIGVAQTLVPSPVFALVPEVTAPQRLGLGFGIISTCLNLGIVVGPAAVGMVRDATGTYPASYWLMAGFALMITIIITTFIWRQSRRAKED